jgi:hypothetical protein
MSQFTVSLSPEPITVVAAQFSVPWEFDRLAASPGAQPPTVAVPASSCRNNLFALTSNDRKMPFAVAAQAFTSRDADFTADSPSER